MLINGKWRLPGFYFAADKGSGGGTPPLDPPSDPPATPPPDTTPRAVPPESGKVEFTTEQQAYLDKLIGDARKQGRDKAQADFEKEAEKAKSEAEKESLKEQAKWQELAEQHEAKVAELEPQVETLTAQVEAYEIVITEMLNTQVGALGDEAKSAVENLPGEPNALSKLKWLTSNEGLFAPDGKPPGTPVPGRKKKKEPAKVESVVVRI